MKIKRSQKRRIKREISKPPQNREQPRKSDDLAAVGLPPNQKLREFADENYGDTEIPHRKYELDLGIAWRTRLGIRGTSWV